MTPFQAKLWSAAAQLAWCLIKGDVPIRKKENPLFPVQGTLPATFSGLPIRVAGQWGMVIEAWGAGYLKVGVSASHFTDS